MYSSVMEEIKIRTHSVLDTLLEPPDLPSPILREFYFLQLRMICELIAISCLIAHGEEIDQKAKNLKSKYKADEIINRLEVLNEAFYPVPRKMSSEGPNSYHLDHIDDEYLSKKDLIKLYRRCGSVLHKGSLKRMLKKNAQIEKNYEDVIGWISKIRNFLNVHQITLDEGNTQIICQMRNRNEKVQCVHAVAM